MQNLMRGTSPQLQSSDLSAQMRMGAVAQAKSIILNC